MSDDSVGIDGNDAVFLDCLALGHVMHTDGCLGFPGVIDKPCQRFGNKLSPAITSRSESATLSRVEQQVNIAIAPSLLSSVVGHH